MTARVLRPRRPESVASIALLESATGAELHLRSRSGTLLRLPLGRADHQRSLTALAIMASALKDRPAKRV